MNVRRKDSPSWKEIFGIDVQLFASHLAVIHLSLQEPSIETDQVLILFGARIASVH